MRSTAPVYALRLQSTPDESGPQGIGRWRLGLKGLLHILRIRLLRGLQGHVAELDPVVRPGL
jgi:hypothetical protein